MTNFQRTGTDRSPGADPAVTSLLRAAYAAPSDDSYWQSLEKRVMARINESAPVAWWGVFSEWREAGVIAATIALLLAGATMVREQQYAESARQLAAGAAYSSIFDDASADVSMALTLPLAESQNLDNAELYLDAIYP